MPPKRTRARAAESPANDVPRGQRQARAEPGSGVSDQPPAQRRRVEEARTIRRQQVARQPLPDGFYDSVFNARWSHVLGFPEGEGDAMVVRMEVREGQSPTQLWDYRRKGITYAPVEDARQFIAPRPRLLVLSSAKGWPCSLKKLIEMTDCYVNYEVERVWRVVQGDLEGAFGTDDLKGFDL
ncbi:retrotransposon hot spot (RHS) protein, partial [Trypanosoma conorhini]